MIAVGSSAITILRPDGGTEFFDADEVRERIIKSCIRAGIRDPWFAADLTIAIEHALSMPEDDCRTYTAGEIGAVIERALTGAGFPEAARIFMATNPDAAAPPVPVAEITGFLVKYLHLTGSALSGTAAFTAAAANALNLTALPPQLLMELAKLGLSERQCVKAPALQRRDDDRPWLLDRGELESAMTGEVSALMAANVISVPAISALFPAVRVDIDLPRWCIHSGVAPPVTELTLFTLAPRLALAVDEAFAVIYGLPSVPAEAPSVLSLRGAEPFVREFLQAEWPEAGDTAMEVAGNLRSALRQPVFKMTLA